MVAKFYLLDSNALIHASKEQEGQIALWIGIYNPFLTNVSQFECLENWEARYDPERFVERRFLEDVFAKAFDEGRLIQSTMNPDIIQRAAILNLHYNIKPTDAIIAATAEYYGFILVTADTKKDFAPRLEKLNQQGLGHFLLQTYPYLNREETFKRWNEAFNRF